ncbi:WD40/YVTN/BNR-like repeat-containing protein [Microbulbifer rhizosphaerae]|uniref:Uncharacterized protein n=1 Tax=Microbulbifer rhizosphaerae TaxID=1562603 RepID=A0A7W4ZAF6_9GAMM|nr:sialidase family protein [Microbulbifer rhizosphaerae]MBB3062516.1 hypothetical protein [Microbulbifer rhizosphaerae]
MFKRLLASILLIISANGAIAGDGYQWRNITVGAGGFAPNIIFSPAEEGLAYLRTDMGGAYRWNKKLQRWIPLQDQMAESSYFGIESIAADPKDPEVVHVAAGMYKRNPAAMLRSFDRGEHWEIVPVPFRMGGNEDGRGLGERLAIDPDNTDSLYFGSRHDGLWHSRDRGASWHKVKSFPHPGLGLPEERRTTNAGISFVVFAGESVFAGVADRQSAGLYRSDDDGKSWQKISGGPALLPVKAAVGGNNLYIAYSDNIGPNGIKAGAVYKLDIRYGRWTDITPLPKRAEGGFMGISTSRQDPDIVAVSTINRWRPRDTIYLSHDGGRHWRELESHSTRDVSNTPYLYWGNEDSDFGWWIAGLAINPFDEREIVYTTGATVYRTQNAAADKLLWRPWVAGVEQTAVITLTSLPAGPELLSGFGDISGFVHEDFDRSPQRMLTDPLFANTNTIHYAAQAPNILVRSGTPPHRAPKGPGTTPVPTLAWSEDYGKNWKPLTVPPLKFGDTTKRYDQTGDNAITVSADGSTFMFMAPVPQVSRDRGRHWTPVEGLPLQARPVADRVNAKVFYALDFANSEIFVSRDGGATFNPQNTRGLPEGIRMDEPTNREQAWPLLAAPDREGTLWLVSQRGLYHSTDGGRNFKIVKSGITVELMDFGRPAPGKNAPALFAIGSRDGLRAIWRSDDSGRHWLRINGERHEYGRRFRTIAGDPRHFGRVYVATDGRGIVMGEPAR